MTIVKIFEETKLVNPVLLEGLPGMGFVANIATLHAIKRLGARKFAEIQMPMHPIATIREGKPHIPMAQLFYSSTSGNRGLIFLHANTQPLEGPGQYEFCKIVLDVVQRLGCKFVICLGGIGKAREKTSAEVYCAATDLGSLNRALAFGVKKIGGRIFGSTGILLGLSKLRGMRGICLLAETSDPNVPDLDAAKAVLKVVGAMLKVKLDLSNMESLIETIRRNTILT